MGLHLCDRNRKAEIDQVFGHFHADVATPAYNGAFGLTLLNPGFDLTTVRNGSKRKYARKIDFRHVRSNRTCTWRATNTSFTPINYLCGVLKPAKKSNRKLSIP